MHNMYVLLCVHTFIELPVFLQSFHVSKLIWMKQIALYWFLISPIIKAILNKRVKDIDAEHCQQFIIVVTGKPFSILKYNGSWNLK